MLTDCFNANIFTYYTFVLKILAGLYLDVSATFAQLFSKLIVLDSYVPTIYIIYVVYHL